jgi:hypothetical protein
MRASEEDVHRAIRTASVHADGNLSAREYDHLRQDGFVDGPASSSLRREKPWNEWKEEVDLDRNTSPGKESKWTKRDAVDAILEADSLVDGYLDSIMYKEFRSNGDVDGPSLDTLRYRWGWTELKKEAGLQWSDGGPREMTDWHKDRIREGRQEAARYNVPILFHRTRDTVGGVYETALAADGNGGTDRVRIHRLQMVAYEGIESVKGKHVHHKSGHGLDNRRENLESMTPAEHTRMHQLERNE